MSAVRILAASMLVVASCRTVVPASEPAPREPSPPPATAPARVDAIADAYLATLLQWRPTIGYLIDQPPSRHDSLGDNSAEALAQWHAAEDQFLAQLAAIEERQLSGTPQWITYGLLKEELEASIQERICRSELWPVSQMTGWQLYFLQIAQVQPVATEDQRSMALARWAQLPTYLSTELALLNDGLAAGYTSPKSVVERVIVQLDGYLALSLDADPFVAIGAKTNDEAFKRDLRSLVDTKVRPAVAAYRDFLKNTYLPRARTALSVTANPNGRACYEARLRQYTTLKRSPEDVFALGKKTVDANRKAVVEKGRALFGTSDFATIIERLNDVPGDRFETKDEVIEFARVRVKAAAEAMQDYFTELPADAAIVEPYPPHLDGTGVSSRYEAPKGGGPGVYRIAVNDPKNARRGREEIVAFHETYPGHHLQIAWEQRLKGVHPVGRVTRNSAFIEGWARYAEALAEEAGLYKARTGPIFRRAWPARGMVVDPGIHAMGWSRQQAIDFLMESGRFNEVQSQRMVDRIATIPGQLTSYDSGALEIFALRKSAEEKLKDRFDLKTFHDKVLENGTIPLWMLRKHVERWLDAN